MPAPAVLPPARTLLELLDGGSDQALAPVLGAWMRDRRWFRSRTRPLRALAVRDVVPVPVTDGMAAIVLVEVAYTEGDPELYLLPVTAMPADEAARLTAASPHAAIAPIGPPDGRDDGCVLIDATFEPAFMTALLGAIGSGQRLRGRAGELVGRPERAFGAVVGTDRSALTPSPVRGEQSNSSTVFGDRAILKLYRVTQPGINPDLEIGRVLTQRGYAHTPAIAGSMEYRPDGGGSMTAVLVNAFVPSEGNLFGHMLGELRGFFERAATVPRPPEGEVVDIASLIAASGESPPDDVRVAIGGYLGTARLAGVRTGELHVTLAGVAGDPAFEPEPFTERDQRSLFESTAASTGHALALLARRLGDLPAAAATDAALVLERRGAIEMRLRVLLGQRLGGLRVRTHGDLHAEQVLHTGRDLVFIDFEGEPAQPLGQRRLKRSALRDVAGMLRSFHYASYGSLLRPEMGADLRPEDVDALDGWVRAWNRWVGAAFLAGYREATSGAAFLPSDVRDWGVLLDVFLLEKACYELAYELNNRPAWVAIPIRGILQLLGG